MKINTLFFILFFSIHILPAQTWERFDAPASSGAYQLVEDDQTIFALTDAGIYQRGNSQFDWDLISIPDTKWRGAHYFSVKGNKLVLVRDSSVYLWNLTEKTEKRIFSHLNLGTQLDKRILAVHHSEAGIFVMTKLFVYFSENEGATWTQAIFNDQLGVDQNRGSGFKYFVESDSALFYIDKYDLHRSFDHGRTWELVFTAASQIKSFTCINGYQYFLYNSFPRLLRSKDNFKTWKVIDLPEEIERLYNFNDNPVFLLERKDTLRIVFHYDWHSCYFQPFISTDKGETWLEDKAMKGYYSEVNYGLVDAISVAADTMLISNRYGLFLLGQDTSNAFNLVRRFGSSYVASLGLIDGSFYSRTESGFYVSENLNEPWLELNIPTWTPSEPWSCYARPIYTILGDNASAYAYVQSRFWLNLETKKWEDKTSEPDWWTTHPWQFTIKDGATLVQYNVEAKAYQSVVLPFHNAELNHFTPYIRGEALCLESNDSLYVSNDFGQHWGFVLMPNQSNVAYVRFRASAFDVIFYKDYEEYMWCIKSETGIPERIFESFDPNPPYDYFYYYFKAFHINELDMFIDQKRGLFLFDKNDITKFRRFDENAPFSKPTTLFADAEYLWVGTDHEGIFRTALPQFYSPEAEKPLFNLWPNPNSGQFKIASDAIFNDALSAKVFDVTGRLILEKEFMPGQIWDLDVRQQSKGLYFVELKMEGFQQVLKVLVQ